MVLTRSTRVQVEDLPANVTRNEGLTLARGGSWAAAAGGADAPAWHGETLEQATAAHERKVIQAALLANGWNRQRTAEQLGIDRTTLYKKIKAHRLDPLAA